jgi:NAD(P) transhydrogenase subunit beta
MLIPFSYLVAATLFILALRGLRHPKTATTGNIMGMIGMGLVVLATLALPSVGNYGLIALGIVIGGSIGAFVALRVEMTDLPQLVALFNAFVGLAAVFVSLATFINPAGYDVTATGGLPAGSLLEISLSIAIGAVTFTGSLIAFGKLSGLVSGAPVTFPGQLVVNGLTLAGGIALIAWLMMSGSPMVLILMTVLFFVLGLMIVIPIGGADMPVVVSMLNSYSGWASVGVGFTLENNLMIIVGTLVGASGAILSYIMCKGMNRSFANVLLGGFGDDDDSGAQSPTRGKEDKAAKKGSAEDAAYIMQNASNVIIVPGYGMAVAQAQHVVKEMTDLLKNKGVDVKFAIHPVAGRMPGHMNVLLAEANVDYEDVYELEDINRDFAQSDVAFVIGANDITNPSAKTDPSSPIYGMPVLDVGAANTCLFVKRSLGTGYAGVDNELFYADNTMMLLDDAKAMCEDIIKALDE